MFLQNEVPHVRFWLDQNAETQGVVQKQRCQAGWVVHDQWLGIVVSPGFWDLAGSSVRLEKMTTWKAEQMASMDGDLEPLANGCWDASAWAGLALGHWAVAKTSTWTVVKNSRQGRQMLESLDVVGRLAFSVGAPCRLGGFPRKGYTWGLMEVSMVFGWGSANTGACWRLASWCLVGPGAD